MKISLAVSAAALLVPIAAGAHNYTNLEGGFVNREIPAEPRDSGFRVAGEANVASPLALFGEYADTGPFDQLSAGALFHTPISPTVDFDAGPSVEHADNSRRDDTGFGARAGVRWQLANAQLELAPEVRYVNVLDENGASARLGALYRLTHSFDLSAAGQVGEENRVEAGLRYNFGPRITGGR